MNGVPAHITYPDHDDISYGENELMGKMWNRYVFETGDIQDSFLGPMTKSAVRCMDAAEGYLKDLGYVEDETNLDGEVLISAKFDWAVTGASKRGWTVWLMAAVDPRIYATFPVVCSMMNVQKYLHHHHDSYQGWSFAMDFLMDFDLTPEIDSKNFTNLVELIDMYKMVLIIFHFI